MSALQTEWTEHDLLETTPIEAPLIAGGVRCHGGFDADGAYVSPRTANRWPAIEAWEATRVEQFATPVLDIPLDTWPESYPNVAQAKHLVREGVPAPIISTLTRIGTVEGFGAMIRYSAIPDLQACLTEDVQGTALSHLDKGLFEAHARDEAGYGDEGGHKQMWFAARDVAFDCPVTEDQTTAMLARMGLAPGAAGAAPSRALVPERAFGDIDADLESLIARMAGLLLIEISAFHTFAWAEEVLADNDLVAGEGEAARLVSYIRADESPHVAYLKTVLSELRDRTFVTDSGRTRPGTEVVGTLWERAKGESLGARRQANLALILGEVEHALERNARRSDILDRFHELGSIRPGGAGAWVANTAAA